MPASKTLTLLCLIFSLLNAEGKELEPIRSFRDLEWSNRVILILDSKNAEADIQKLTEAKQAIDERDLIWILINERSVSSNYKQGIDPSFTKLAKRRYEKEAKGVFLIGKDGGTKSKSTQLDLETIFALIDTMPMRIQEMEADHQ
ncbi:MAG: DUF4174 domain-containing protein [Verrucomicrobiota bacterium]